jgi:hypothetical protein
VERHSRFTALVKVRSKDTAAVVGCIEPANSQASNISTALVDVGSRAGDG